jgi:hypothetical protein
MGAVACQKAVRDEDAHQRLVTMSLSLLLFDGFEKSSIVARWSRRVFHGPERNKRNLVHLVMVQAMPMLTFTELR